MQSENGSQSRALALHLLHSGTLGNLSRGPGAGFGAAYGTAKSGVGIASMGVMRPELVMKSIVPVVMAGVLGIYGLIIAVIISTNSEGELRRRLHVRQRQHHEPNMQLALRLDRLLNVACIGHAGSCAS